MQALAGRRFQFEPTAVRLRDALYDGRAGHAAAVMSLVQSAKPNEHDPYAYLKDVKRTAEDKSA